MWADMPPPAPDPTISTSYSKPSNKAMNFPCSLVLVSYFSH
jgi:hypothetical protein